jgi:hypothetical protein
MTGEQAGHLAGPIAVWVNTNAIDACQRGPQRDLATPVASLGASDELHRVIAT